MEKVLSGLVMAVIGFVLLGANQHITSNSFLQVIVSLIGLVVIIGACSKLYFVE